VLNNKTDKFKKKKLFIHTSCTAIQFGYKQYLHLHRQAGPQKFSSPNLDMIHIEEKNNDTQW